MEQAILQVMTATPKPTLLNGDENQVKAQFNPQTLQITYHTTGDDGSNTRAGQGEKGAAPKKRTGSLAELSFDLLFDTTQDGHDVRRTTLKVVAMMQPDILATKRGQSQGTAPPAPPVLFYWGNFSFLGQIQSVSETLDFFSPLGVALRATVKVTMTEQKVDRVNPAQLGNVLASANVGFSASVGISAGIGFSAGASLNAGISVGSTPLTLTQSGDSLQALAGRAGLSASWKAIANANNIDNPRAIPAGTPLNLNVSASTNVSGSAGS